MRNWKTPRSSLLIGALLGSVAIAYLMFGASGPVAATPAPAAQAPAPAAEPAPAHKKLPKTGSPLPLLELAGALSMLAGAGVRRLRKS